MTRSADYKQGYGKGYYAGRSDQGEIERRHLAELKDVAARAERAESASGVGHCERCRHWDKRPDTTWGYCSASRQPGTPWGCWGQGNFINERYDQGRISTTPRFGCVLFMARS